MKKFSSFGLCCIPYVVGSSVLFGCDGGEVTSKIPQLQAELISIVEESHISPAANPVVFDKKKEIASVRILLLENEVDKLSKVLPEILNNKGYFSLNKRDYDIPAFLNSDIRSDLVVFSYCSKLDPQRFVSYTIWPSLHRAELSITATVFIQGRPDCGK